MMQVSSRFVDNNDGTVTDGKTGLVWFREDIWQKEGRWVTYDEAKDCVINLAHAKFAGKNNWRLPSIKEALSLYDETQTNKDKYGNTVHLPGIFPEGTQATIWCEEPSTGNDGYTVDFRTGKVGTLYKSKCPRMSARAVSGDALKA
jgi:hypothetical protein